VRPEVISRPSGYIAKNMIMKEARLEYFIDGIMPLLGCGLPCLAHSGSFAFFYNGQRLKFRLSLTSSGGPLVA
jgi:hypothetical protein